MKKIIELAEAYDVKKANKLLIEGWELVNIMPCPRGDINEGKSSRISATVIYILGKFEDLI